MHGEQAAADQVRLHRLAQPQRDVGLAHAKDRARRRTAAAAASLPGNSSTNSPSRGASQLAPSTSVVVTRRSPCGFSRLSISRERTASSFSATSCTALQQRLALFGEDQAARMAMKQRRAEIAFERADLPADRRLAEAQRFARVGERARLRGSLKDAQLVPVHDAPRRRLPVLAPETRYRPLQPAHTRNVSGAKGRLIPRRRAPAPARRASGRPPAPPCSRAPRP